MDLNHLLVFIKVAESGSFSAAARQLGLPKSSVSLKITQTEQDLGVRLLHRTTRRVSLTEVGERIYESAIRIAAESEDIKAIVHKQSEEPSGLLRITAPLDFGLHIVESWLNAFLTQYPKVSIEFDFSNRVVDIVSEGFDLALRATDGFLRDSSLVAKGIAPTVLGLFASPRWVEAQPELKRVEDLRDQAVLWFAGGSRKKTFSWTLRSLERELEIPVLPTVRINDFHALLQAATAGLGVALLPKIIGQTRVQSGELVQLFPEWTSGSAEYFALYPSRRYLPPKTRAFIDFMQQRLGDPQI